MSDELQPPKKGVELEDSGTTELDSSSDEHFSDATEGKPPLTPINRSGGGTSPIPTTRVERVDDTPRHGEVPGTPAYEMRMSDAVPDELEIVPEGARSRSNSRLNERPLTPGGTPVPKTIVERVDDKPAHGEVPGTEAHEMRKMDAEPDVILKVPEPPNRNQEKSPEGRPSQDHDGDDEIDNDVEAEDEGFGDDFDDFEEGEEADDEDFGDFDDGFQQETQEPAVAQVPIRQAAPPPPQPVLPDIPPILDFKDYNTLDEVTAATLPHIEALFPNLADLATATNLSPSTAQSVFLSERSLSLWSQLVAPPPLQPPNWVRSRIRRLFLVSLGVPVDLDEILPASKQKKLVLPSINFDRSPRLSGSEDPSNPSLAKLRSSENNASRMSVDSASSQPGKLKRSGTARRGPPPAPEFDFSSTTILCSTTDAALQGFSDEQLKAHVEHLKDLSVRVDEVLKYWQSRRESAVGDKEAFEGVIENLVKHAKKIRK